MIDTPDAGSPAQDAAGRRFAGRRFAGRDSEATVEEGTLFAPKFDAHGLIPVVATDAATGAVVMFAHMNAVALAMTLETRVAHYWSRSRQALWKKGETSGNVQRVLEMRTDCDQDVVWLRVETAGDGANCHTGRHSCFYRSVELGAGDGPARLAFDAADQPRFDPSKVYGR